MNRKQAAGVDKKREKWAKMCFYQTWFCLQLLLVLINIDFYRRKSSLESI